MYLISVLLLFFIKVVITTAGIPEELDVLKMFPCPSIEEGPCIALNNCSARQNTESCVLIVSVPPQNSGLTFELSTIEKPTQIEVWTMGLLSVGIISLSGITGAVLWPLIDSPLYNRIMTTLIGLAVGSLTSTALFQLIPEAFQLSANPDLYLKTALFGWLSIWLLFNVEALSKIIFRKEETKNITIKMNLKEEETPLKDESDIGHARKGKKNIAAAAWVIIFGDGIHNFIDGLTIGAGYSQSISTGIGLSIAIACEEFPHELGDFAILLQSGMSLPRALCYNFLSACTAFVGLVLGIVLGQLENAHYIFAFAGGIFLYVSLAHLIPELKDMAKKQLRISRGKALSYIALQNLGMILGTTILFFITKYNEKLTNLF